MQRIAILGAGKIGESLLAGLVSAGWTDIVVTSRHQPPLWTSVAVSQRSA